jgi:hypothetical protein
MTEKMRRMVDVLLLPPQGGGSLATIELRRKARGAGKVRSRYIETTSKAYSRARILDRIAELDTMLKEFGVASRHANIIAALERLSGRHTLRNFGAIKVQNIKTSLQRRRTKQCKAVKTWLPSLRRHAELWDWKA